ncbi:unnamed protein product [Amoebophrya sp. A25]|nr:unnamed protein product [Amoebophrya sp. A25]|eukprot:GSA25T00011563001.1
MTERTQADNSLPSEVLRRTAFAEKHLPEGDVDVFDNDCQVVGQLFQNGGVPHRRTAFSDVKTDARSAAGESTASGSSDTASEKTASRNSTRDGLTRGHNALEEKFFVKQEIDWKRRKLSFELERARRDRLEEELGRRAFVQGQLATRRHRRAARNVQADLRNIRIAEQHWTRKRELEARRQVLQNELAADQAARKRRVLCGDHVDEEDLFFYGGFFDPEQALIAGEEGTTARDGVAHDLSENGRPHDQDEQKDDDDNSDACPDPAIVGMSRARAAVDDRKSNSKIGLGVLGGDHQKGAGLVTANSIMKGAPSPRSVASDSIQHLLEGHELDFSEGTADFFSVEEATKRDFLDEGNCRQRALTGGETLDESAAAGGASEDAGVLTQGAIFVNRRAQTPPAPGRGTITGVRGSIVHLSGGSHATGSCQVSRGARPRRRLSLIDCVVQGEQQAPGVIREVEERRTSSTVHPQNQNLHHVVVGAQNASSSNKSENDTRNKSTSHLHPGGTNVEESSRAQRFPDGSAKTITSERIRSSAALDDPGPAAFTSAQNAFTGAMRQAAVEERKALLLERKAYEEWRRKELREAHEEERLRQRDLHDEYRDRVRFQAAQNARREEELRGKIAEGRDRDRYVRQLVHAYAGEDPQTARSAVLYGRATVAANPGAMTGGASGARGHQAPQGGNNVARLLKQQELISPAKSVSGLAGAGGGRDESSWKPSADNHGLPKSSTFLLLLKESPKKLGQVKKTRTPSHPPRAGSTRRTGETLLPGATEGGNKTPLHQHSSGVATIAGYAFGVGNSATAVGTDAGGGRPAKKPTGFEALPRSPQQARVLRKDLERVLTK